ncbi:protein phosphatase 2C domain-containing protein [Streptomyces sp. NPDC127106]|uniref:protein phosphatase 2C domain-containing protein n=1 Tax=Streptomyces sp. NPDC127106 TaxID=3345360 RepID=UPI003628C298
MSQQGADDWWQRLYGDPDAGAAPDPGDTLESRYDSAASLTSPPPPPAPVAAPPGVPPQPGPPDEVAPPARPGAAAAGQRTPAAGPSPAAPPGTGLPSPGESAVVPAQALPPDAAAPPAPPVSVRPGPQAPAPVPPPPVPPRTVPSQPVRPDGAAAGPGSGRGGREPDGPVGAGGFGVAPWAGPGLPRPRDPREGGTTGYGLGDVTVPPVPADADAPATPPTPSSAPPPPPQPVPEPPRPPVAPPAPQAAPPAPQAAPATSARPEVQHLGDRAPTYAAEPGALPLADPAALDTLVPDTVLEGARHGACTLRAASVRGDSARYRGEARRDVLLTARFGSGDDALVLVALAGGDRAAAGAAEAAAELCHWIGAAVGRSQPRLADDIRAGRRDALRSGLQRLTDRGYGRLRARAAELGHPEDAYTAGLRALLLPIDPECRTRVCFGAGPGGLFRLRSGAWRDLETAEPPPVPARPDGEPGPEPGPDFRFRAAVARPGDALLLCSGGLADPMREEELLPAELAARWSDGEPPGLAAFLADTQLRVKGYADDRTAAAVWES